MFPKILSFVFLLFSLYPVAVRGLVVFGTDHTRNLWSNQIWVALLLSVGIGFFHPAENQVVRDAAAALADPGAL